LSYDGLVNYSVACELKSKIVNGKIDKIFEPNFEEIILGIYSNGEKFALDLVINPRFL
jgi:predicted ribosome quality control (RQC) complex YloA/Tae2 family protein